MEIDGQLTKRYDGSPTNIEGAMFGESLYKELQDVPKESSNGNYMLEDEAPIDEDMQGLLSGDQVAPMEKENKEQFGLMLQLDIVFEQLGEVFDDSPPTLTSSGHGKFASSI